MLTYADVFYTGERQGGSDGMLTYADVCYTGERQGGSDVCAAYAAARRSRDRFPERKGQTLLGSHPRGRSHRHDSQCRYFF
jgi:hypothetical protein